jgi:hypothetical protein
MPSVPRPGLKGVYVELPPALVDDVKAFGSGRGQKFRDVVEAALRRHLAYPPPVEAPLPPPPPPPVPPPHPFPDAAGAGQTAPPVEATAKGRKAGKK